MVFFFAPIHFKTEKYESYTELVQKNPTLADELDKYNLEQQKIFHSTFNDFTNKYADKIDRIMIFTKGGLQINFTFRKNVDKDEVTLQNDLKNTKSIVDNYLSKYNKHIMGVNIVTKTEGIRFGVGLLYDGDSRDYDTSLLSS